MQRRHRVPPSPQPPAESVIIEREHPPDIAEAARQWVEDHDGWEGRLRSQGNLPQPDVLAGLRREYANLQARLAELQRLRVGGLPNREPPDPVCALRWAVGRASNELAILDTTLKRRPAAGVKWTSLVHDLYGYVRRASEAGAGPGAPEEPDAVPDVAAAAAAIDQARTWCDGLDSAGGTRIGPARHSPDFRSVHWFGADYQFTAGQAAVIGVLWNAWENGCPNVGHETLLSAAGLDNKRLVDVFKRKGQAHPAWGTMIVSSPTNKGTCRLQEPA
jgi:hypothetical protein